MTQDTDRPVTQRELDQRVDALEEHIDLLHTTDQIALKLQWGINEDHFVRLNNENQRIAVVLAQSIPREVFEVFKEENSRWRTGIERQMAAFPQMVKEAIEVQTAALRTEFRSAQATRAAVVDAKLETDQGGIRELQDTKKVLDGRNLGIRGLIVGLIFGNVAGLVSIIYNILKG